jgi:extracellular elastinolytic metalloproteinase
MARNCPGGRARLWRAFTPVALVLLAVALPSAGQAVADVRDAQHQELRDLDARGGAVAPSAAQRALARRLRAGVSWNTYGTPQSIYRHGGFLGRPQAATAAAAARGWLAAHKRLFRLDSLAGLRLMRGTAVGRNGHVVHFRQVVGGRALAEDGLATVGLRRVGKRWAVVHVSSTLTGETAIRGSVRLGAKDAWRRAARNVGHKVARLVELRTNAAGYTLMRAGGLEGVQSVRRALVPLPDVGVVPAFETVVEDAASGETKTYRVIVDARSGKVLVRRNLVHHLADNPRWDVFPANPRIGGNRYPWNYPSTDIRDIWCWTPGPGCELAVSGASPHTQVPWDTIPPGPGMAGVPQFTTIGNNATNQEAWVANPMMGFPLPTSYRPVSPNREYLYPFTNAWFTGLCSPTLLTPHPPTAATGNTNDLNAAIVNLFAMHNRVHDFAFHLGFDEEHWNAQEVNTNSPSRRPWIAPGMPSAPQDEVVGNAQASAISGGPPNYGGRDNANMSTRTDGTRSTTNMFLWQPLAGTFYAPCVDGDFDMSVIGHEYGHMIENRMIGKVGNRQGHHAGAMGESFGDLNGMEYLNEYGFVPVSGENRYSVGPYVTSNKYRAIRNYGMNFPYSGGIPQPSRYPFINALNFSDIGYDFVGAQVHADGEIWSATNFDIRRLLLDKYPGSQSRQRQCADGQRPPQECPGNRRWFQLYYDAMVLMIRAPSMLDARNAILAADTMRFGGANHPELWYAFATRGFGQSATVSTPPAPPPPPGPPKTPADDPQPKPAFDSPEHSEAVVQFRAFARDEGNAPVNANVYVGHYEARVSPIADTNPATGPADGTAATDASNLDNAASFTSRTYEFVAHAQGYGHLRFRARLRAGESRTITLHFATNWASRHKGAVAAGEGVRLDALIDDTENSNWEFSGRPVNVAPHPTVTVALATGTHRLDRANVSAYLFPTVGNDEIATATQNRFTALRQFELRACRAGADSGNPTCDGTVADGWESIYRSSSSFFPGDTPRPVAPELLLRGFDFDSERATHVQLVVLDNQCTGNTAFQGDQDNDPVMFTDCRTGSPHNLVNFPPRANDVRAAELQVYSSEHRVTGADLAEDGDDDDDDDDD